MIQLTFCHHLLTFKFFQTCMNFFILRITKYIQNMGNQIVDEPL